MAAVRGALMTPPGQTRTPTPTNPPPAHARPAARDQACRARPVADPLCCASLPPRPGWRPVSPARQPQGQCSGAVCYGGQAKTAQGHRQAPIPGGWIRCRTGSRRAARTLRPAPPAGPPAWLPTCSSRIMVAQGFRCGPGGWYRNRAVQASLDTAAVAPAAT
jgi:hypothetical protein